MIFGPDLSHFQHGADLARVAAEGCEFVIGKVSQGASSRDPDWPMWRDAAPKAGLLLIGYHMITGDDPARQAANCRAALGDPTIPLALDWEASGGSGSFGNFLAVLAAFRAAELNVRLAYCPRWYWTQQGSPDMSKAGIPLWSSRYVTATGTPAAVYRAVTDAQWGGYGGLDVALVQFSDRATIAGRAVDCSAFNGTRTQLAALLGAPTPTIPEEDDPVEIKLVFAPDGVTFRGLVPAEAGAGSARYKGGWIKTSVAFGPGVHVRMCARDTNGIVMPGGEKIDDVKPDHNSVLTLPDGTQSATVEGKLTGPGGLLSCTWIPDPR